MRNILSALVVGILLLSVISCSGSITDNPLIPAKQSGMTSGNLENGVQNRAHLWGYYDVYIDIETGTVEAVDNRQAVFTANVTKFINSAPAGLGFKINGIVNGADYIDIDIDVAITHPFPGMPQYHGYDVRGVFMGHGSAHLEYNNDLVYPLMGVDQFMFPDPVDGYGGPDGYTRWFNKAEFSTGGMPLFQYTQGKMASPGFNGNATLNPYKYFADGLDTNDDLWTWLKANPELHGRFSSGATNDRNYYLRFPNSKGVKYGYAIIANWGGILPNEHPSNAPEAVGCKVVDSNDLWFSSPSLYGGKLILDISVWNWNSTISAGIMEDYDINIESSITSDPWDLDPEMVPVGGDSYYSTYHVEIVPDFINSLEGHEFWVIVEQTNADYSNDFGVNNLAWDDRLAAFFHYEFEVSNEIPAWIKLNVPNGGEVWVEDTLEKISWDSPNFIHHVDLHYSKDDFVSDINLIVENYPNSGSYLWQIPYDPSETVKVRVADSGGLAEDVSDNYFTIEKSGCKFGNQIFSFANTYLGSGYSNYFTTGGIQLTRQSPEQYFFIRGVHDPYYNYIYAFKTSNVNGGPVKYFDNGEGFGCNSARSFMVDGHSIPGIDRIFYQSGAGVANQFKCVDWNGTDFVNNQTLPKADTYGIWDFCVTPDGDLIAFTSYAYSPAFYFYKKSTGYTKTQLFNLQQSVINFNTTGDFKGIVYNPVMNAIMLFTRTSAISNGGQLYAVDMSGNLLFEDKKIFETASLIRFYGGLYIDPQSPDCRILVHAATDDGKIHFARYSANLEEKKVYTKSSPPQGYAFCRGDIDNNGNLWAPWDNITWFTYIFKLSPPSDW